MASAVTQKKNYRSFRALQQFYTGGPYAVSSDGSFIVCACDDTIKIVDSSNAAVKSTIEGDSEPVTALFLSPDDNFLFSSSHSRQIRVWDLSSLKCLRSWKVWLIPFFPSILLAAAISFLSVNVPREWVVAWEVGLGILLPNSSRFFFPLNSFLRVQLYAFWALR